MSKSLKRVRTALEAAGVPHRILEMPVETRTAQQAADAAGCHVDQIAKSILFAREVDSSFHLFLTAGGNRVDPSAAERLLGGPVRVPAGTEVRSVTGFAIGGVSPVGHLSPIAAHMDPRLFDFAEVWAAAGTPRHIFAITPDDLRATTGAIVETFTDS